MTNPEDATPDHDQILFRSDDLLVRAVAGGEDRGVAFVTFDSYSDHRTLDRPGFGEHFFQSRGIDAVHVVSRENRWYQHPELGEAMAAIAAWTAPYDHVVAYGSSMGGFAALTYGAACGAHTGVALSPQFSVDPAVVPFEDRWNHDVAAIRFGRVGDAPPLPLQYLVYDPHHALDARHAALFGERSPTIAVRAPYGGHPVGAFINEVALLEPLLDGIAARKIGPADVAEIERGLRERRRRSGQYLFTLAQRVPDARARQRLALARMAAENHPDDPGYLSFHAAMLDAAGRYDEAYPLHRAAMAIAHAGPHPAWRLTMHYRMQGQLAEARRLAEELVVTFPQSLLLRQSLAAVMLEQRRRTRLGRLAQRLRLEPVLDYLDGRRRRARRPRGGGAR